MSAQSPAKAADGVLVGPNGMTCMSLTRTRRQIGLQRRLRHQLAPADGHGRRQAAGDYTVITRDDGKKQWALKGKPLYYWAKDTKPGDKTGDNVGTVWHVVKP
jgi:predicted lipoprotein with Yx(FWY)xxD motif